MNFNYLSIHVARSSTRYLRPTKLECLQYSLKYFINVWKQLDCAGRLRVTGEAHPYEIAASFPVCCALLLDPSSFFVAIVSANGSQESRMLDFAEVFVWATPWIVTSNTRNRRLKSFEVTAIIARIGETQSAKVISLLTDYVNAS